jgi:hypothetical protein
VVSNHALSQFIVAISMLSLCESSVVRFVLFEMVQGTGPAVSTSELEFNGP